MLAKFVIFGIIETTDGSIAPQSPRYSSLGKILNAKTLDDIWG